MWQRNLTYFSPSLLVLIILVTSRNEQVRELLLIVNTVVCTTAVGSLFMFSTNISARSNWIRPYSRAFTHHAKVLPNCGIIYLLLMAFSSKQHVYHSWFDTFMHHPLAIALRVVLFIGIICWLYFRHLYHERFFFPKRRQALLVVISFVYLSLLPFDLLLPSIKCLHSTLFSWYILTGGITAGTALATFAIMKNERERATKPTRLNLGLYLFALSCFRAYLAYSQDFLVWYGNLPEEVNYFIDRETIKPLLFLSILLNYIVPVVALFARKWKKSSRALIISSVAILIGYNLDIYILIHPQPFPSEILSFGSFALISVIMIRFFIMARDQKLIKPLPIATILVLLIAFPGCTSTPNKTGIYYAPDMHHTTATTAYQQKNTTTPEGTFCREKPILPLKKNREDRLLAAKIYNAPTDQDTIKYNGHKLYTIYCMQCHGEKGNGKGPLVTSGKFIYPPKNLTQGRSVNLSDGQIFHDISVGYNLMGAHGSMLTVNERWAVVRYVRKLQ